MRHVVDKVILYLRQTLLSKYSPYCEYEDNKQQQCKDNGRNHKLYTREEETLHLREVNVKQSFLCGRVVGIKYLSISISVALCYVIWATIDLPSVTRRYIEVVIQIDTIATQLCSQVAVKTSKVHSLCKWLIAGFIEYRINYFIQQGSLINVALPYGVTQRFIVSVRIQII